MKWMLLGLWSGIRVRHQVKKKRIIFTFVKHAWSPKGAVQTLNIEVASLKKFTLKLSIVNLGMSGKHTENGKFLVQGFYVRVWGQNFYRSF